jgi:hypothetical protein
MQILHTVAGRGRKKTKDMGLAEKVVGNIPSVARKTDECLVIVTAVETR